MASIQLLNKIPFSFWHIYSLFLHRPNTNTSQGCTLVSREGNTCLGFMTGQWNLKQERTNQTWSLQGCNQTNTHNLITTMGNTTQTKITSVVMATMQVNSDWMMTHKQQVLQVNMAARTVTPEGRVISHNPRMIVDMLWEKEMGRREWEQKRWQRKDTKGRNEIRKHQLELGQCREVFLQVRNRKCTGQFVRTVTVLMFQCHTHLILGSFYKKTIHYF